MITRIASIYLALVFLSLDCQATIMYLIQPDQLLHYQPEVPVQGPLTVETSSRMVKEGIPETAAGKPKTDKEEDLEFVNLIFDSGQEIHLGFSLNDPINSSYNDFFVFEAAGDVLEEGKAASFSFQYVGANNAPSYLILNGETIYDLDLSQHAEGTKVEVQIAADKLLKGDNKIGIHSADLSPISFSALEIEWAAVAQNQLLNESEREENHKLLAAVDSFGTESIIGRILPKGAYPSIPKGLQNAMPEAVALNVKEEDIGASQSFEFRLDATALVSKKKDLRLFYFDQQSLNWVDFRPDTAYVNEDVLVLKAPLPMAGNYFAGFKSTPAGSEGNLTLPTQLKELAPPSPFTGYGSIAPPSINQKGSANTSFPINIPPGRNKLAPNLAIAYSSDSKGGLLGEGWDLPVSSIDVDLRWGVPRFLTDVESETYTIDGAILSMEGGFRGNRRDANGNYANRVGQTVQFFPKTQGSWQKIERFGSDPQSYFWVVTTADQLKMYFGTTDGISVDHDAIVTNDDGSVLSWKLKKVQDKWGNYMEYNYQEVVASSNNEMLDQAKQMLLTSIRYTGFSNSNQSIEPPYVINFTYLNGYRTDARVSYRTGMKRGKFNILNEISVSYDPDPSMTGDEQEIRKYEFTTSLGDFGKTLLTDIKEVINGQTFYEFELDYYQNSLEFEVDPIEIPSPWDDDRSEYSMLGASDNSGFTAGGLAGAGILSFDGALYNSIYGGGSFGRVYNYGRSSLQDINGDGLLDYVIQERGWDDLKYYPGRIDENGLPYFGNEKVTFNTAADANNNRFHYSLNKLSSTYVGAGISNGLVGFQGAYFWNWNKSFVETYTSDLNGDGIADIVEDHIVSFGRIDPVTHNVYYETTSSSSPNPIYDDAIVNYPADNDDVFETEVVKTWRALVDGVVDLSSTISLDNASNDGIEYSIEHVRSDNSVDVLQGFTALSAGSQANLNMSNISVSKGERLLFRTIGKANTRYDLLDWNPDITYQGGVIENADQVDINSSDAQEGFLLSGQDAAQVNEYSGVSVDFPNINLTSQSDTVTFSIRLFGYNNKVLTLDESIDYHLPPGSAQTISKSQFNWSGFNALIGAGMDFSVYDQAFIRFEISSPSNVNWGGIDWRPEVLNTTSTGEVDFQYVPVVRYKVFESLKQLKPAIDLQNVLPLSGGNIKFEVSANASLETNYYNAVSHSLVKKFMVKIKTEHDLVQTFEVKLDPSNTGVEIRDLNYNQEVGECSLDQSLDSEVEFSNYKAYVSVSTDEKLLADLIATYLKVDLIQLIPDGEDEFACELVEIDDFVSIYYTDGQSSFGPQYLGWGYFGWNGDPNPIDPTEFNFGTDANGQFVTQNVFDAMTVNDIVSEAQRFGLSPDLQADPFKPLKPERGDLQELNYFTGLGALKSSDQDAFVHPFNQYARILSGKRSLGNFAEVPTETIVDFVDQGSSNLDKTAPHIKSRAYNTSLAVGGSFAVDYGIQVGLGVGVSFNTDVEDNDKGNQVTQSLIDFNGDGYPDELILNRDLNRIEARLTDAQGGRRNLTTVSNGASIWRNQFGADGINYSVSGSTVPAASSGAKPSLNVGLGASNMVGQSKFEVGLLDINGDGLPDLLSQSHINDNGQNSNATKFYLNNGVDILTGQVSLMPQYENISEVKANTTTISASVGGAAENPQSGNGISGGISYAYTTQDQELESLYRDVNGDGLLDIVVEDANGYKAYLNYGTEFSAIPISWSSHPLQNISKTHLIAISAIATFTATGIDKVLVGVDGKGFFSDSYQVESLMDVNGDGYVDLVSVDENNLLKVYLSKVSKSNLLKSITSPTGSTVFLDYKRVGNKYGYFDRTLTNYQLNQADEEERVYWDMNYSKWVLSEVRQNDFFLTYPGSTLDDGADEIVQFYHYDGGVHDRRNREFLGFTRIAVESDKYQVLPAVGGYSSYNPHDGSTGPLASLLNNANELQFIQIQQFPEPNSNDLQERVRHRFIANLMQESYNVLLIKEPDPNEQYVPKNYMIEHNRYAYDYHGWVTNSTLETLPQNTVDLEDVNFEFASVGEMDCIFPELTSMETFTYANYEANSATQKFLARKVEFTYNRLGLMTRAILNGSDGPGLEAWQVIGTNDNGNISKRTYTPNYRVDLIALYNFYYPQNAAGRVGQLERYRLYSGDTINSSSLLRRSKIDQLTSNELAPEKVGTDNDNGSYSFTTYHYTDHGLIDYFELPTNHRGDNQQIHLEYDPQYSLYPSKTTQRFLLNDGSQWDEANHMVIDVSTGLLNKSIDANGQATEIYYDDFYRVERIYGPRELADANAPYTVAFEYWDGDFAQTAAPWSLAKQYLGTAVSEAQLGANPSPISVDLSLTAESRNAQGLEPSWNDPNIRRSAIIVDGWGRIMQSQREVSILGASNTNVKGRRISGPTAFDNFGNLARAHGSIATNSNVNESDLYTLQVSDFDNRSPAYIAYIDAFNRNSLIYNLSDFEALGSRVFTKSESEFDWGTIAGETGEYLLNRSSTWGHEHMQEELYYDYFGHAKALVRGLGNPNTTKYEHDVIGQVLKITNPAGIETEFQYDLKGRVTQEDHADRGISQMQYDLAGNLTQTTTSATSSQGAQTNYQIDYAYEYDRLISKTYPLSSQLNNLSLVYGRPGQNGNTVGRVRQVLQGTQGSYVLQEQFRYSKLGQISREDRTVAIPQFGEQRFVTDFVFDSWGRVRHMRYPDGEKLEYHYTAGGDLEQIQTSAIFKSSSTNAYYLKEMTYDGFGQPLKKRYGNDSQSSFEYDDLSGSLLTYELQTSAENSNFAPELLLDKDFTYDATGNIKKVENHQGHLSFTYNNLGGSYDFEYTYDDLNQLSSATGNWQGANGSSWDYSLNLDYDLNGRVTYKAQSVKDANLSSHPSADYNFSYVYADPGKNALSSISSPTDNYQFEYDVFGNMSEVTKNGTDKLEHLYDEEHRLRGSLTEFDLQHNVYDPYGIRLMKGELMNVELYDGGEKIGNQLTVQPYLVNAGPHYLFQVFDKQARISKHYYGGNGSRVASRLLSEKLVPEGYSPPAPGEEPSEDPAVGAYFGDFDPDNPAILPPYTPPFANNIVLTQGLQPLLNDFGKGDWYETTIETDRLAYPLMTYDRDACEWQLGSGGTGMQGSGPSTFQIQFCNCVSDPAGANEAGIDCDLFPEIYWYHGDGLGNVEYLTDLAGMPYEYFWYAPTGELIEHQQQGNAAYNTPFQFSARTFDGITDLVYMGARYYSPKFSIFTTPDPLRSLRSWISPYNYVQNNPIMRQDPTGMLDNGPDGEPIYSKRLPAPKLDVPEPKLPRSEMPEIVPVERDRVIIPGSTAWILEEATVTDNLWKRYGQKGTAFFVGAVNALLSNLALGIGRQDYSDEGELSRSFIHGQILGDSMSAVTGFLEMLGGVTLIVGGGGLAMTGGGVIPGAASINGGIALVSHGYFTMVNSIHGLMQSHRDLMSAESNGSGNGGNKNYGDGVSNKIKKSENQVDLDLFRDSNGKVSPKRKVNEYHIEKNRGNPHKEGGIYKLYHKGKRIRTLDSEGNIIGT